MTISSSAQITGVVFAMLVASHGIARAQAGAASESLFQEGRRLLQAGEIDSACEAFSASLELDRALGTLLNLARCTERQGRTATAWSLFSEAEALASQLRDDPRFRAAKTNKQRLEPQLWKVRIELADLVAGSRVWLDGREIPLQSLGYPLAIDPGEHAIRVEQTGKVPARQHFDTQASPEGSHVVDVTIGPLDDLPTAPPAPPPDTPQPASNAGVVRANDHAGLPADAGHPAAAAPGPTASKLSVGVGLGGLVLLGVAGALVVDAFQQADGADCNANQECSARGLNQRQAAQTQLAWGYGVGAAGAIALGVGVFLYLDSSASAPSATRRWEFGLSTAF